MASSTTPRLAPKAGLVAKITSTSYALTGLAAGTPYAYVVEAVDSQGRTSQFAPPATFYTGTPSGGGTPTPTPSVTPTVAPTPTVTPTPTPTVSGALSCSATYALVNSWPSCPQAVGRRGVTLAGTPRCARASRPQAEYRGRTCSPRRPSGTGVLRACAPCRLPPPS